jgi:hypothetical protein
VTPPSRSSATTDSNPSDDLRAATRSGTAAHDAGPPAVVEMCFGSLLVAVIPGYATIGLAAPALLVLLQQVFLTEAQLYAWGWRIPVG